MLFRLGIVLNKKRNQEGAVKYLVESIKLNPYNWSCWTELSSCIATTGMLLEFKKQLPETFMRDFWEATTRIELYSHFDIAHELLNGLSHLFPDNTFIQDQHALGHYHDREFEAAEYFYDHVGELDPLRLDHVGEFSNVLYVTVNHQKLISLAHQWFEIEKYRPETCVAVANYYSAKGLHEKAVQYYQRALKIDRNFLSAWTLLGHELVELKNAAGAIKSYRSAVDIDPRDWRAWYGLGQGYELLKRYDLAVYYYEKSTTLRPYDGRLWTAKADCYAKMPKHYRTAIQCYKRALVSNDHNPATQCKLAAVYIKVEEPDRAAFYYRNALDFPDLNREFRVEAATYLSDFYRSRNLVQDAKNMLQVVIENSHNALQVADARALLEEMVEIQVEAALDGEDVDVELGE
ncbi:hypothetical protein BKA69DRAFT_1103115 [Paraphysoderma sedebokerense]|nr:hypothetical protein BKA69DRAFT_1103115 [Paraphysoderma sedebokerense]